MEQISIAQKNCIVCGASLNGKRRDAEVCSDSCRTIKSQRKANPIYLHERVMEMPTENEFGLPNNLPAQINPIPTLSKREIALQEAKQTLQNTENQHQELAHFLENELVPRIHRNQIWYRDAKKKAENYRKWLSLENEKLYEHIHQTKLKPIDVYAVGYSVRDAARDSVIRIMDLNDCRKETKSTLQSIDELMPKVEGQIRNDQFAFKTAQEKIKELKKKQTFFLNEVSRLNKNVRRESDIFKVSRPPLPPINQTKPITKQKNTLSGKDLANKRLAPSIQMQGDLGEFLGKIDRNKFFCALTGDAGAGKSTFSFYLAEIFCRTGFSVKYYSLEMGINQFVQTKVRELSLKENFHISDTGNLDTISQDAQDYDVLIVDSFAKLKAKAEDIDNLRNEFPNTFFICIFQKTNAGNMKGGASVLFDCTMNIDLKIASEEVRQIREGLRQISMVKSRYGTQGKKIYF